MTCKDCIHYEICDEYVSPDESFPETDGCRCFRSLESIRAEAITEFAERLKRFYNSLKGQSPTPAIVYHIDQIKNELIGGNK